MQPQRHLKNSQLKATFSPPENWVVLLGLPKGADRILAGSAWLSGIC